MKCFVTCGLLVQSFASARAAGSRVYPFIWSCASRRHSWFAEQVLRDVALDLVGPAVDRGSDSRAQLSLHSVFAGLAVAAHHLHAFQRSLLGDLGALELCHRRLRAQRVLFAAIDGLGDVVDEAAREGDLGVQIRQSVPQRLERRQRLVERPALTHVGDRVIE